MVSTQLLKSFNAPKAEYCTGGIHFGIHGNDLLKEVNNWTLISGKFWTLFDKVTELVTSGIDNLVRI